eukprot:CAMPEP_0113482258 /NCGR_PEP_ID=MMETSP0014_2-20120614/22826_1 /TAXON_ID=2857 /ORGANISM="Nitzschia sp." /LENGTH=1480 /DNA_ID=CAMNT_0000375769 /DNA_START=438 /DNA_END=4877 /DNA_ORIENTATION=- /assembly_acc=CAM_ASM_000159
MEVAKATTATAAIAAPDGPKSSSGSSLASSSSTKVVADASMLMSSSSPITLSISQDDARQVMEASKALKHRLDAIRARKKLQQKPTGTTTNNGSTNKTTTASAAGGDSSDLDPPLRTVSAEDDEDDSPKNSSSNNNATRTANNINEANPKEGESEIITTGGDGGNGTKDETPSELSSSSIHELMYEAVQQCEDNPMLQSFLDKMKHSGASQEEIRVGVLVFSDMDFDTKIRHIFELLQHHEGDRSNSSNSSSDRVPNAAEKKDDVDRNNNDDEKANSDEPYLTQNGAVSMFRAIIVAISSCIKKNERFQIDMDDAVEEPSAKRRKRHHDGVQGTATASTSTEKNTDEFPSIANTATTSFDSTVATLKDEEDDMCVSVVKKEFEDIARHTAEQLVAFASKKSSTETKNVRITFSVFQDWRVAKGTAIAPWLSMLDLSKLTMSQTSNENKASPKPHVSQQKEIKQTKTAYVPSSRRSNENEERPKAKPVDRQQANKKGQVKESSRQDSVQTQTPIFVNPFPSKPVLSFDFAGSLPEGDTENAYAIEITEENLFTFRNLVSATGLRNRSCEEIARIVKDASIPRVHLGATRHVLPIDRFHTCLNEFIGSGGSNKSRLTIAQREVFSSCFVDFFSCFNTGRPPLKKGEAETEEIAIGLCFVSSGNKSSKLAAGFDILEKEDGIGLSNQQLVHFLKSYLIMLVGISLLTSSPEGVMKPKMDASTRKVMLQAVEHGARWTLRHFLAALGIKDENDTKARHTFETFARWYSDGGYNVAPWLELLSLEKLLALVNEAQPQPPVQAPLPTFPGDSRAPSRDFLSPRRSVPQVRPPSHPLTAPHHNHAAASSHHSGAIQPQTPFGHNQTPSQADVLFTFPLANKNSLVVLKEDATYVRGVVEQLATLSVKPDELWSGLYGAVSKRVAPAKGKKSAKSHALEKTAPTDKATFVSCMQATIKSKCGAKRNKKRSASGSSKTVPSSQDVLTNFFQSFDLMQSNRVALNELMGGLTLLCGGKKSTKLAFAFSVFDKRPSSKKKPKKGQANGNSLDGEELFLFLRSFLIVMFSCCRQSWSLTDDSVNRFIADTANMVTDDVMRYQWQKRKKGRIDFDEFGQWYNEGGFETAPWLELLDLKKWVMQDDQPAIPMPQKDEPGPPPLSPGFGLSSIPLDPNCPPPPPDADMDLSFLDDDHTPGIKPMDSVDEVELFLMQQSSASKDDPLMKFPKSPGPLSPKLQFSPKPRRAPPVKFHLVTNDSQSDGFQVAVSQKRIVHLRQILTESGLFQLDGETAARRILERASGNQYEPSIKKDGFDAAMRKIIAGQRMSLEAQQTLSDVLSQIFFAFDDGTGSANAFDVACGFTVLCRGKKSDKLEYAFDLLDRQKRGSLSIHELKRYLGSFLTVLINVVSTDSLHSDFMDDAITTMRGDLCDRLPATLSKAVEMGCQWASDQAIRKAGSNSESINFDHFADWYTSEGYSKIPWLELLDLNKW